MGKTGFEKATAKMFPDFGPSVKVVSPEGDGRRMDREERARLREEMERSEAEGEGRDEDRRARDRKELLKDLVALNVLPKEGAEAPARGGEGADGGVVEQEARRRPGRPSKSAEAVDYVMMNFRVDADFRRRFKSVAVMQGRPMQDLFEEAVGMLFEKYNVQ